MTKKQTISVVLAAVLVVVLSSLITWYVTLQLRLSDAEQGPSYQNITFTDAVTRCHKDTQQRYNTKIQTLITDNHSSRFDNKRYQYKIFLQMTMHPSKTGEDTTLHYINCFVRAKNGAIVEYEKLDSDENSEPAVDDNTNAFGIPKR